MNTVDEESQPEDTVNFLRSTKLYESDYSSGEDNMVALLENDIAEIEPLNIPHKNRQHFHYSSRGLRERVQCSQSITRVASSEEQSIRCLDSREDQFTT